MRPPEVFVRPLSHEEALRLKRLVKRSKHASTRERASIVLGSNAGNSAAAIAASWLTDPSHVRKVIHEFNERGVDSLRPNYRGGRPRWITCDQRQPIVSAAGARPDTQGVPLTRWSLPRLAAYLLEHGIVVSPAHLGGVLAEANLSFQRTRTWKASPDPDCEAKAARVLELKHESPADGVVIAFDQMGPVNLRPTAGTGWAPKRRPERRRAAYTRRHGTRYVSSAPTTTTPTGCASGCAPSAAARTTSRSSPRSAPATRHASGSTGSRTTSPPTGSPTSASSQQPTGSSSSRPRPTAAI